MSESRTLRLLLRQLAVLWHSGLAQWMAYALVLSVLCIISGRALNDGLASHFSVQSVARFGAERSLGHSTDTPIPKAIGRLPLQTSHSVIFNTMVYAGDQMQLVRVRATDENFPLRGQWQKQPERPLKPKQIWLDARAMQLLGVSRGDTVELGRAQLTVAGLSVDEPVGATRSFWFLPKVVIHLDDVSRTGAIGPSSRVQYLTDFSGAQNQLERLDKVAATLDSDWQYRSAATLNQRTQSLFTQGQQLIRLAIGLIVLICFYTLFIAIRGYAARCQSLLLLGTALGGRQRRLFLAIGLPIGSILLLGTIIGLLLSYGCLGLVKVWGSHWLTGAIAKWDLLLWGVMPLGMGLLMALTQAFAMLRLSFRQLRSQNLPTRALLVVWALGSVGQLALLLDNWRWLLWITGVIAGALLLVVLLRRFLCRAFLAPWSHPSVQFARMQLSRVNFSADSLILGVALALGLTAAMWSLQHQLLQRWLAELPQDTPNYFLLNLEPSVIPELKAEAKRAQISLSEPYTIVRGRVTAVNGRDLCQQNCADGQPQAPGRELNFTQSALLPSQNVIRSGKWWTRQSNSVGVSLEQQFAERMQAKVGDTMTFSIYGESFELPILSIRQVNWQTFQPNFFVIFSPGALDDYAGMVMLSGYIQPSQQAFLEQVRQLSPGMNLIDISQILSMTRNLLGQVSLVLKGITLLLLLAALLLMNTQLMLNLLARQQQMAVLRLMGATRNVLRRALFIEFALLALLSTLLGVTIHEGILAMLTHWLSLDWQLHPALWGGMLLFGSGVIFASASHFIRRLLKGVNGD